MEMGLERDQSTRCPRTVCWSASVPLELHHRAALAARGVTSVTLLRPAAAGAPVEIIASGARATPG